MLSIIASLIASSDSRRLNRLAASYERRKNMIVDEEEAEILEFYEKEMESGSFRRMLSFDVVDDARDDLGTTNEAQAESSLHFKHDSFYTRVLQESDEYEEPARELVSTDRCDDEPSNQESSEQDGDFHDCESQSHQQSQSESISSSISSLTSDDIEASFSFSTVASEEDISLNACTATESQERPHPAFNYTGSPLHSEAERTISATADTPVIQNLFRDRKDPLEDIPRPQLERRVSFNPEVTVKEIPRRQANDHLSSEKYLYFMLLAVGIMIAVFSFFPAHPSLSPIASVTKKEALRRADSILSSQWDVEL
jgi:hypothetical protein